MSNTLFIEILEQFYQLANRMNKMQNKSLSFPGTEPLNTPAIHLIDVIGKHNNITTTEIAEILGVTKGAVSQMTSKLERRKFIKRKKDKGNEKEVHFFLTAEGLKVYQEHEKLHEELYSELETLFSQFEDEDMVRIKNALISINMCMEKYKHI